MPIRPSNAMRTFIEKKHRGRGRQDGTPDSVHLKRVTSLVLAALRSTGELPAGKKKVTIECAALGHDVLEDTNATPKEVEAVAGSEALEYIEALTNRWGDGHPAPYVRQVRKAPEEARLIKLADLCDNTLQASISIHTLGTKWMRSYFLPIIDPMRSAISTTRFTRYPKTGALLTNMAALARAHLEESMENISSKGTWRS